MFFSPYFLAADASAAFDVVSIMSDAVSTIQGQLLSTLAVVVPAIVTVTGIVVCTRFGLKWLRSLGKA